ncbi:mevalonate kinase family protein [Lentisalinibacter sediminis]|uniref:mevalonate kinase family protein n=1 Tax=Lentisalinibacter sediminis TaxID=2992237 RepID=UPI00386B86EA
MSGADAPGKLVLTGEYAVLDGAPAIVTAVDRRAVVTVETAADCRVQARGPDIAPAAFGLTGDGRLDWHADRAAQDYRLLVAVTETLAERAPLPADRPFQIRLDTSAFYSGADKLGLGSSAALTVALTAALCRHFGRTFEDGLAYEAHRRLQGGEGSGLDIAASVAGGVIRFVVGDPPLVEPVRWPDGLEALFVWTGRSARTTPRVRRYREWRRSPAADGPADRLIRRAAEAAAAWQAGDTQAVLETTAAWARALDGVGEAARIDIGGGGHAELARLADGAGVVYKPSGAGGGDLGLALAGDRRRLQSFRAAAERAGFRPLPLRPDDGGLATVE